MKRVYALLSFYTCSSAGHNTSIDTVCRNSRGRSKNTTRVPSSFPFSVENYIYTKCPLQVPRCDRCAKETTFASEYETEKIIDRVAFGLVKHILRRCLLTSSLHSAKHIMPINIPNISIYYVDEKLFVDKPLH